MSIVKTELNGYTYTTEILEDGSTSVTIKINPSAILKGSDCVTRTVLPTVYAAYTAYYVAIDGDGVPFMSQSDGETVVSTDDIVKAKAELEKTLKCTVVVHGVRKECAGTYGIPKELFSALALPVTRPDSQKPGAKRKDTEE